MGGHALGNGRLLAYGVTGLPLAALGLPLYVYLPAFYAESVGIAAAAVGLALLVARLFDVVTDPLAGWLSDRWPNAVWRRRGLMLIGAPMLLLGVEKLFRPEADADGSYLLLWALVAYLGWTLVAIPYSAWGAELSDQRHERTRIAAAREGFVIVGTLAALAIPALAGVAADPAGTLAVMAQWLWWVLPVAVLLTVGLVPAAPFQPTRRLPWREGLRLLAGNRPLRRLLLAYVVNGTANGLPATLFVLFVAQVLEARELTGPLLAIYFAAGIVALPAWVWLARRVGKTRAWTASLVLACLSFVWVPLLGAGDALLFGIVCVVSGLCLGADLTLPASIQADVVALDREAGGGERAGLFFGLWGMATKIALALAVGIAFPLLDLVGFAATADNDRTALLTLALLYGGLPVALKLLVVPLVRGLDTPATAPSSSPGGTDALVPAPVVARSDRRPARRLQQHEG
jgi:GPH family glycoside/pentoside/hexuronide:cation symporter